MLTPVFLGIMDPLYTLFGQLMGYLYEWLRNYGLVIIIFNVVLKTLVMPLSFKSSKGMAKQQFLQDDINEIKRIYAGNPQKAQEAQMELMKSSGASMTAGCLPMVLQMVFLLAVWRPIQRPLSYLAGVSNENLTAMAQSLASKGLLAQKAADGVLGTDIPLLASLRANGVALAEAVDKGWIQLRQILDLDFLGMDLGKTPSIDPKLLFGADTWKTYVPLLILVILMVITMVISTQLGKLSMPMQQSKEEKAREAANPAKKGQTPAQAEGVMKSMNIVMPLMMIFMAMTLPAAMALFWLVSNIMQIIQTLLTYQLYTKPMKAAMEEKNAAKQVSRRRNKKYETVS